MDKIVGKRAEGSCKIDVERVDGWLCKKLLVTREELVENALMGSTANEDFERRNAATWCGSKVADWRIAVVRTFASLAVMTSMASKAPLASMDLNWNVMVPLLLK